MNVISEVELYDFEIRIVMRMAQVKNKNNRKVGAKETNFGSTRKLSSEERDANAFAGEFSYAKIRNLFMSFDLSPRKGGTDFVERDGKSIDVKTRGFKNNPDLLVSNTPIHANKGHCDYYALVIGKLPSPLFELHGWITEADLILPDMLVNEFSDGRKMEKAGFVCHTSKLLKEYPGL